MNERDIPVGVKMAIGIAAVGSLFAFAFLLANYEFPSQRRTR